MAVKMNWVIAHPSWSTTSPAFLFLRAVRRAFRASEASARDILLMDDNATEMSQVEEMDD